MQTPAGHAGASGVGRGRAAQPTAIDLPDLGYVLQTEGRLAEPRADTDDWPWLVGATAAAMRHHPLPDGGRAARAALLATKRPHGGGLSSWVAVVGPGAMEVLEELGERIDAAGARRSIVSAPLAPNSFRPFIAQDGRGCSLVLLEHGRDLVTEWNLSLIRNPEEMMTMPGLKAAADAVEARLTRTGLTARRWEIRGDRLVCLADNGARAPSRKPEPGRVESDPQPGFLAAPALTRAAAIHRVLFGEGALRWETAIRTTAARLRAAGALSPASVRDSIRFGIERGLFDQPKRGSVRAILTDPSDLTPEAVDRWAMCAISGLGPLTQVQVARHVARAAEQILGRRAIGKGRGISRAALNTAIERLIERGTLQRRGDLIVGP